MHISAFSTISETLQSLQRLYSGRGLVLEKRPQLLQQAWPVHGSPCFDPWQVAGEIRSWKHFYTCQMPALCIRDNTNYEPRLQGSNTRQVSRISCSSQLWVSQQPWGPGSSLPAAGLVFAAQEVGGDGPPSLSGAAVRVCPQTPG